MADKFYSAVVGDQLPVDITEGAATSGEAIELRVSDTAYTEKTAVIAAVEGILLYLKTVETNPIA